jgi:hypothetical protein
MLNSIIEKRSLSVNEIENQMAFELPDRETLGGARGSTCLFSSCCCRCAGMPRRNPDRGRGCKRRDSNLRSSRWDRIEVHYYSALIGSTNTSS